MITKRIQEKSAAVIEQYRGIPYFNNRRTGLRGALPVQVGKGSPKDIHDEIEIILIKNKIDRNAIDIKKLMVDSNIGIDCSGFAYYVLQKTNYHFPYAGSFIGKMFAKFNPVKNIDVKTFAHNSNSKVITLREVEPGDIVTMVGNGDASRNHIIVIDQIEYQNNIPAVIHYAHSIAIPEDGQYGHGVRSGKIEIINPDKPLTDQIWSEEYLRQRALSTTCELRRLVIS